MRSLYLLVIFNCCLPAAKGADYLPDTLNRVSVEFSYYGGGIIKHTDKIIADTRGYAQGWEAGLTFQTHGKQPWNKGLGYPSGGVSFLQFLYPNRDTLGMAVALLPHVRFDLLRSPAADMYIRIGLGLAVASEHFDAVDNPNNTIIATKLNTVAQIKLGTSIHLSPAWSLSFSSGLTHISNGGTKQPNLGINFIGADMGVHYHFNPVVKTTTPVPAYHKNVYWIRGSAGVRQRAFNDGPQYYPIYSTYIGYSRHTGFNNRVAGALCIAYDNGNYHKILDYNPEITEKQKAKATNVSILVGDELLIGQLGLMGMIGFYLYYPEYKPLFMYFRLGINVYTKPLVPNSNFRCFFGLHLKTHGSTAEYFEMATGVTF